MLKTTRPFNDFLDHFGNDKRARGKAIAHVRKQIKELKGIAKQTNPQKAISLALAAQGKALLKAKIENPEMTENISCKSGCANCCSLFVEVTDVEADIIVTELVNKNMLIDENKMRKQAFYSKSNWFTQSFDDRACVFLNADKSCSIYNARPSACRSMIVISDPKHCKEVENDKENVTFLDNYECEIIRMAIVNTAKELDSLPALVNRKLRKYYASCKLAFKEKIEKKI